MTPAETPRLRLEEVTKSFGGLDAVAGVSLDIAPGERHGLIGPNGAGKTTLLSLVRGQLRATSGRVWFDGTDITRTSDHHRARLGLASTFQRSTLFEGSSVRDNVRLAIHRRAGVARRVLRSAAAAEFDDEAREVLASVGLGGREQVQAGTLSHGERRQLELAIGLALRPSLLLLDEPAAGLSPRERAQFVELVAALPPALTVLLVEHDMQVVFACVSRLSVLVAGRLLVCGSPAEVAASRQVQEAYLGSRAGRGNAP